MNHATGADVPAAIAVIQQAGWSVKRLADDLQVHVSSVYRWRNGTRTPNRANFVALTALVNMEYAAENCRRSTRGVVLVHLQRAYERLETDADRARDDAKAEELAARMEAAEQRRKAEQEQRHAEVRALATAHREAGRRRIAEAVAAAEPDAPRQSAFADLSPFEVFGQQDQDMATVEAVFGS